MNQALPSRFRPGLDCLFSQLGGRAAVELEQVQVVGVHPSQAQFRAFIMFSRV